MRLKDILSYILIKKYYLIIYYIKYFKYNIKTIDKKKLLIYTKRFLIIYFLYIT